MRLFLQYLRGKAGKIVAFFLFAVIFIVSFALYHLPLAAVWYPSVLCVILGLAVLLLDFRRVKARHETLRLILCQLPTLPETLPAAHTVPEEDYRALDAIVRRAVRRFAGEFIGRKLKLCYEPLNVSCVTDEKWLLFVIEQVLSNALKYTRAGSITIELEAPKTLVIRDTGIGVAPEDLPRIFEKGYTGYNGRGDQKASGLGLYLCRTICKRLGHTITASSVPDHGTAIRITLEQRQVRE